MEERIKILEMLSSGIITVDEANDLLKTMDNQKVEIATNSEYKTMKVGDFLRKEHNRALHIKVLSADGDKVNVNIPVSFLKASIKSGTINSFFNKSIKINGVSSDFIQDSIDLEMIIQCIENDVVGNLVDIESADGDKVLIYID